MDVVVQPGDTPRQAVHRNGVGVGVGFGLLVRLGVGVGGLVGLGDGLPQRAGADQVIQGVGDGE